jgi:hypothetical protein
MADNEFDPVALDLDGYTTPLRSVSLEIHEIYEELKDAGFPERVLVQIIAHMVSDTVLYRDDLLMADEEDDEDEDDENGDTLDGPGV